MIILIFILVDSLSTVRERKNEKKREIMTTKNEAKAGLVRKYLALFGQAFKEATCAERLGVANMITQKNQMEELQKELEGVSRKIENLEERTKKIRQNESREGEREGAGPLRRVVASDVVSPMDARTRR